MISLWLEPIVAVLNAWVKNGLQPFFYWLLPIFVSPLQRTSGMAVTPHYEALKALASLSVGEEFCQKIGGKVFGYSGETTPVYQQLCVNFALLIEDMVGDLQTIKAHITCTSQGTANGRIEGSQEEP